MPTNMPVSRSRHQHRPIQYRHRQDRVWSVRPIAVPKVVAPAIDAPNRSPVLRFEHESQERFARWIGETDWREHATLARLFETTDPPSGMGVAPASTVELWAKLVATMGPDELADFEARTFATASLSAVRIAI